MLRTPLTRRLHRWRSGASHTRIAAAGAHMSILAVRAVQTPCALFRVGNADGPALDSVRTALSGTALDTIDVDVTQVGETVEVVPFLTRHGSIAGVSLRASLKQMLVRHVARHEGQRFFWELASGTAVPDGLDLRNDPADRERFLLGPAHHMPLLEYQRLLRSVGNASPPAWRRWDSVTALMDSLGLPPQRKKVLLAQLQLPKVAGSRSAFLGVVLLGYCDYMAGSSAVVPLEMLSDLWDMGEQLLHGELQLDDIRIEPPRTDHEERLSASSSAGAAGSVGLLEGHRHGTPVRRYSSMPAPHVAGIRAALRWKQAELEGRIDAAPDVETSYSIANDEGAMWESLSEWAGL